MSPAFRRRIEFIKAAHKRRWVRIVYVLFAVIGIWDTAGAQFVPKSMGKKWPTIYELVMSMSGLLPWWGWVIGALVIALIVTIEYAVRRTVPLKPADAAASSIISNFTAERRQIAETEIATLKADPNAENRIEEYPKTFVA